MRDGPRLSSASRRKKSGVLRSIRGTALRFWNVTSFPVSPIHYLIHDCRIAYVQAIKAANEQRI